APRRLGTPGATDHRLSGDLWIALPGRRRMELAHPRALGRTLAHDLDADRAGADIELLDPDRRADHPGLRQDDRGDPLRQRLYQRDVLLRDDHADAVEDHVVGEHVADILGHLRRTQDGDVDVEADLLNLLALVLVGPDAGRQHEIAHQDAIGRGLV